MHIAQGDPGIAGTVWAFLARFHTREVKRRIIEEVTKMVSKCKVCIKSKPNNVEDRGLFGVLLIPSVANDIIYVDFTAMDPYGGFDMVLSIVCGLSRFCQFIPCKKSMDGQAAYKLLWTHWIQVYGAPERFRVTQTQISQIHKVFGKVF